jgi:hypothetical protein
MPYLNFLSYDELSIRRFGNGATGAMFLSGIQDLLIVVDLNH